MVSKCNIILVVLLLLSAITACSKSPEAARKELGQMNIDYTDDSFVKSIAEGDKTVVELFLTAGKSPNLRMSDKLPILIFATSKGHNEIVKLLIAKGADVNGKDLVYGRTPLIWAIADGKAEIVKILLNKGADINAKAENGLSALMNAIAKEDVEIVKALIDKGADVNVKFDEKTLVSDLLMTPLVFAVNRKEEYRNPKLAEVIKVLVNKGRVNDKNLRLSLLFAKEAGYTEAVDILKKAGAKE